MRRGLMRGMGRGGRRSSVGVRRATRLCARSRCTGAPCTSVPKAFVRSLQRRLRRSESHRRVMADARSKIPVPATAHEPLVEPRAGAGQPIGSTSSDRPQPAAELASRPRAQAPHAPPIASPIGIGVQHQHQCPPSAHLSCAHPSQHSAHPCPPNLPPTSLPCFCASCAPAVDALSNARPVSVRSQVLVAYASVSRHDDMARGAAQRGAARWKGLSGCAQSGRPPKAVTGHLHFWLFCPLRHRALLSRAPTRCDVVAARAVCHALALRLPHPSA